MDAHIEEIIARLRENFPEGVAGVVEEFDEVSVEVARERLVEVAAALRDEFEMLVDWSCIDWLGIEPPERRFLMSAQLASTRHALRLRLRVFIPEGDDTCPSLCGVWPGANFLEREAFDFFGITFEGHPDLRRIFMPDEWQGFPQRKDYPLGGVNTTYEHGAFIPPPDIRRQPTSTSGYPGRIS
ncbi:MAG: NADH-quinone oxidoreductase subunit C [Actinomycetota bacterium]|nr:NADH-quinone oxidoreductase subunit C [Actinomycetota bacterium]